MLKMGETFYIILNSKIKCSHKWFDDSSQIDWVIFALVWNCVLCILDIRWVFTAVVLVKSDVLFLVPTGKILEIGFLECFLIKACLSVEILFLVKKNG